MQSLKILHQSAGKPKFISKDQNVSDKNFRSDLSFLWIIVVCGHIFILIIIIIITVALERKCLMIRS
jgi:hypothetical protein